MFGVGIYELIIIVIVAVVVLKPKDFFQLISFIAKLIKKVRNFYSKVQEEIDNLDVIKHFDDYDVVKKEVSTKNNHNKEN